MQRREAAEARRRHQERFDEAEARLAEQRAERKVAVSQSRGRTVMLLASALVLCVTAFVAYSVLALRQRASADVASQISGFRGMGLTLAEAVPSKQGAALSHAANVEGCSVFVGVGPKGPLDVSVTRANGSIVVGKRVAVCSCATERVTVAVPAHDPKSPPGSAAIGVLTGNAEQTGGWAAMNRVPHDGIVFAEPPPADCVEAQLDAWVARAAMEEPSADAKAFFPNIRGATVIGHADATTSFVAVQTNASRCYLAVASTSAKLRGTAGKVLAEGKTIAFCDEGSTKLVLKPAGSTVTVASFDAAQIGGLLGVVETTVASGFPAPATYLSAAAAKTLPKGMLLASGLLAGNIESPDSLQATPVMRAVALAHESADVRDPKLPCTPAWPSPVAVCVLPQGQVLGASAQSMSLAVSPLSGLSGVLATSKDPAAAVAAAQLLALARRFARDGFEATMMESARDLGGGTDVMGRQGDVEIAAVAVQPQSPFVVTLSDGKPWKLGEPPRIAPIAPAKTVMMSGVGLAPPSTRRTIVWRRGAK